MFVKSALVASLAVLAAPAIAAPIGQGHAQFARQLGVDATQYSLSDLIKIEEARREGDVNAENFVLNKKATTTRNATVAPIFVPGHDN